jgi:hypothetical protein
MTDELRTNLATIRKECFCNLQFNVKKCSIQGIFKTADVVKNDPTSLFCPADTIDVMSMFENPTILELMRRRPMSNNLHLLPLVEQMIRFPIAPEELERLRHSIPSSKPSRPYAFIFGHGLWNDLDLQATINWLDLILENIISVAPWLQVDPASTSSLQGSTKRPREREGASGVSTWQKGFWPRLFLTPNAAGKEKPDEWIVSQGNKALMIFEDSVAAELGRRGVEHLGTYNMSVQSNKYDGV